jgi:hypothetical protein
MLKHDELICKKVEQGMEYIRPRSIINLDPVAHTRTTRWSRMIANKLHQICDGKTILEFGAVKIRIIFASGYTWEQLNEAMDIMRNTRETVLMVAGDDTVLKLGEQFGDLEGELIEGDFTKIDITQDDPILISAASQWLEKLGVPESTQHLYFELVKKMHRISYQEWKIRFTTEAIMPTGMTLTTVYNSTTSMQALGEYARQKYHDREKQPEAVIRELGLQIKVKKVKEYTQVSFLKGWWQEDILGNLVWLPLPSCILKLGKTFREPCEIMKVKDVNKALAMCAYSLACSPGKIPLNYPIVTTYLKQLKKLSIKTNIDVLEEKFKRIKITERVDLDFPKVVNNIMNRYSIEIQELKEIEQLWMTIQELPMFISHPALLRLRDIDYG